MTGQSLDRADLVLIRRAARGGWLSAAKRDGLVAELRRMLEQSDLSARHRAKALETLTVLQPCQVTTAGNQSDESRRLP